MFRPRAWGPSCARSRTRCGCCRAASRSRRAHTRHASVAASASATNYSLHRRPYEGSPHWLRSARDPSWRARCAQIRAIASWLSPDSAGGQAEWGTVGCLETPPGGRVHASATVANFAAHLIARGIGAAWGADRDPLKWAGELGICPMRNPRRSARPRAVARRPAVGPPRRTQDDGAGWLSQLVIFLTSGATIGLLPVLCGQSSRERNRRTRRAAAGRRWHNGRAEN